MRLWHLVLVGFAGLAACGEQSAGADEATLCVVDADHALRAPGRLRLQAAYYRAVLASEDPSYQVDLVDDVAVRDGRGCLTLRAPSPAIMAGAQPLKDMALLPIPFQRSFGMRVWPIEVALYLDGNDSGAFEGASDRLLGRFSRTQSTIPLWVHDLDRLLGASDLSQLEGLDALLAPGHRPFLLGMTDHPIIYFSPRQAVLPRLVPWGDVVISGSGEQHECADELFYPACMRIQKKVSEIGVLLIDPRIDQLHLSAAATAGPQLPFENGVPIEVPVCLIHGPYLVAQEEHTEVEVAGCSCDIERRFTAVLTLADAPVPWLTCRSRENAHVTQADDYFDLSQRPPP